MLDQEISSWEHSVHRDFLQNVRDCRRADVWLRGHAFGLPQVLSRPALQTQLSFGSKGHLSRVPRFSGFELRVIALDEDFGARAAWVPDRPVPFSVPGR